ncbi:hypothetical protein SAMN02745248_00097 [Hathewaya proteolytica DSM 3090]|uniref:ATPase n=1 Tax=Hathewaya proteolytica DSM 3090 TaxID=1121331 RepID=A0A1M6J9D1_9CLOT|nr:hypothetical protein [Hathewaya proteolytica]SHJ43295.1 hypothetical protein SAMN02745248_00097 [Hathewaya proteolytica DSM 3090]
MDVIGLLEYFQEVLDTSSKIPMSGKVLVSKKEMNEIIDKIIDNLPDELKKATWICSQKDKIINDAEEKARAIEREAVELMKQKVNNHEIVKEAEEKAKKILASAQKQSKAVTEGTKEYSLALLEQVDNSINTNYYNFMDKAEKEMESFRQNIDSYIKKMNSNIKENMEEIKEL